MTPRSSGAQTDALALMAAAGVVVADVLRQNHPQVLFADDEHSSEAPGRGRQHCDPNRSEHRVEPGGELPPDPQPLGMILARAASTAQAKSVADSVA